MSAALDDFLALAYAAALGISPGPMAQAPVRLERAETTLKHCSAGSSQVMERTVLAGERQAPLEWNMPSTVR